MAAAAVPLLVASAVLSAGAAVYSGVSANKQSKFQANVLRQEADRERKVAAVNEEDFRREQERLMASRRAALGAAGVRLDEGSPLLTSEDFASEVELQARRIREGGEVKATRLQQQASLERFRGRSAQTAGFLRGGSLLLSGTGKAFA